jgi:hypothetical protein
MALSIKSIFDDNSIGVACEKLHPPLIEHDLCSKFDLVFTFSVAPLWQLGILDIASLLIDVMIDLVAQVVAHLTANAGLVAIAKINKTDIERMYLNMNELYHSTKVFTRNSFN